MKSRAVLAVPALLLALSLSACGGSAPGLSGATATGTASAATGSAAAQAPLGSSSASAPSSGAGEAPSSSAEAPTTSAEAADVDAAASAFVRENDDFSTIPLSSIRSQLSASAKNFEAITVSPSACKEKMIKSVTQLPSDMDIAMAARPTTDGADTVAFYGNPGNYLSDAKALVEDMAANCAHMEQSVAGQGFKVDLALWEPGIEADLVFGTVEMTDSGSTKIVQTKVYAQRGDTGVQVQILGNTGGEAEKSEATKLVESGFAALDDGASGA